MNKQYQIETNIEASHTWPLYSFIILDWSIIGGRKM